METNKTPFWVEKLLEMAKEAGIKTQDMDKPNPNKLTNEIPFWMEKLIEMAKEAGMKTPDIKKSHELKNPNKPLVK